MPKLPQTLANRLMTRFRSGEPSLADRVEEHEVTLRKLRRHVNRLDALVAELTDRSPSADTTSPVRSFELRIPTEGDEAPRALRIDLPHKLYVPQLLDADGFAGYEARTLACWMAILSMPESGAAFDVGANVGPFAWLAAALTDRRVVAFEPVPNLLDAVTAVASANGLEIVPELIALSDHDGSATFYLSDQTDSSNSLLEGFRPSSHSIDVVVRTLDSYLADTDVVPHALKIDTETTEPDVIRGARSTVLAHRPWMIVEVLAGRTEDALTEALAGLDYAWYRIDDDLPMSRADVIVGDTSYTHNNWLLAPRPPDDSFWDEVASWSARFAECQPLERDGQSD